MYIYLSPIETIIEFVIPNGYRYLTVASCPNRLCMCEAGAAASTRHGHKHCTAPLYARAQHPRPDSPASTGKRGQAGALCRLAQLRRFLR